MKKVNKVLEHIKTIKFKRIFSKVISRTRGNKFKVCYYSDIHFFFHKFGEKIGNILHRDFTIKIAIIL